MGEAGASGWYLQGLVQVLCAEESWVGAGKEVAL